MLFCAARSPAVLACSSNYKAQRSGLITSVARSGPRPEALSTGTAWARPPTSSGVYGVFPAVCTGHAAPRLPLQGHQSRAPMPTPASQQFAAARRGGIAAAAGPGSWNPVEVVKREAGLQSNKLPDELRERVETAVEELRFRVTASDVAARAGLKLQDAESALQALAYDASAALEVSQEGVLVYAFPNDFRSAITSRSLLLKARPLLVGAQRLAAYLTRVAFGTALVSSIFIVWLAVVVILNSRNDRDNRRSSSSYYNSYGSYGGGGPGMRVYFDLTDLLIYLDPNFGATSQERLARGAQLTFVEAIFSFVFGDGDPNKGYEASRWAALGQLIQDRGGVVTAEEMAPYLDPPSLEEEGSAAGGTAQTAAFRDESFVLPALIHFGGEPFVDEATGALLYRFPALQRTAGPVAREYVGARASWGPPAPDVPLEEPWELTAASGGQLAAAAGLGALNVVGVATLAGLLADAGSRYVLYANGMGWVAGLMPALQAYAFAFFAIPALRWLFNQRRNARIEARNSARAEAARLLNSGQRWLKQKLGAARQAGERKALRQKDMVFTSDKDVRSQLNASEMEEWDKRMQGRVSGSGQGSPSGSRGGGSSGYPGLGGQQQQQGKGDSWGGW